MKHVKKMILVPETEYLTLLAMIKGNDHLAYEKAQVEQNMSASLRQPNTSEQIKSEKYNRLYKQKRQISEKLENRPQKIVIENLPPLSAPNVPPYVKTGRHKDEQHEASIDDSFKSTPDHSHTDTLWEYPTPKMTGRKRERSLSTIGKASTKADETVHPYIRPELIPELTDYVEANKKKFHISNSGKVRVSRNRYIGDYKEAINALGKKTRTEVDGLNQLFNQLKDDPVYISLYNKSLQKGFGKIVPIKRTKTLIRERKFRPQIWAKV